MLLYGKMDAVVNQFGFYVGQPVGLLLSPLCNPR